MIGTNWRYCVLKGEQYDFVRFPSSVFIDTKFINCVMRKAIFRKATFIRCHFDSCQLPDCVFDRAHFIETTFEKTDLREAANLNGVKGLSL